MPWKYLTILLLGVLLIISLGGCEKTTEKLNEKLNETNQMTTSTYKGIASDLENETVIFSFITPNQKKMILSYSEEMDQFVYRFFNKEQLEIQLPEERDENWTYFIFQDYHRGSGENGKMDINQVVFSNGSYRYEIYDNYNMTKKARQVGIRVLSITGNETIDIDGDADSAVGSLMLLYEDYPKLKHENLYD